MPMPVRTKIFLCVLTFVIAFAIVYSGIYPAYSEFQLRSNELKEKHQENQQYLNKLAARAKADLERQNLENQIRDLRKAVPKEPELDLIMLDLENMCRDSKVDLIGVENIDPEMLAKMQTPDKAKANNNNNPLNPLKPLTASFAKFGLNQKKEAAEIAEQSSFKQLSKQVYVTGDYDGFVKMMHRMETYERVIGFNHIIISVPSKDVKDVSAAKAEKLKLKQPLMSFVMTIYYLP